MNRCLDLDRLVSIGSAVDWQVDELLDHLHDCNNCREELGRLASVRGALGAEETPRPEFVDDVMADLVTIDARRGSMRRVLSLSLTPLIAGMTAFFAIAMAATATSPVGLGPVAFGALTVAIGAAWWNGKGSQYFVT